ncbi:MAG TPA: excinuclease ABC subunit UvrB [Verrucomicrobiae bacterium]|nr:excinuclease ABC subunit UvrB [Verrucomicrobiae bacterium]
MEMPFQLVSKYKPRGDQPQAIEALTDSLRAGNRYQTLLGVTGSGKTFTMANVVQTLDRPTLVISHNKTLAAQLFSEFKQFFPRNAVEYFVSYYDYYQPEAYIPQTDTYIEKDASINEQIEKLRLSATSSLLSRRDVIVVASVSCIYGLGSPEDYFEMMALVKVGATMNRDDLLRKLVDMQYNRNDVEFTRGSFRVRGDTVEICPSYAEEAVRVEFFGDRVEQITRFDPLTGHKLEAVETFSIYPAKHWVMPYEKVVRAIDAIKAEMVERVAWFESQNKLVEAQRIHSRVMYDMEMMKEMGFCGGIENYSRHLSGRAAGERPFTLIDFFPKDYLLIVDESHVTVPQIGGMYAGDRSRKMTLVEHGFRLPSALDNRPLNFTEFENLINQCIFVSATPGPNELQRSAVVAEQIIRPTGLVDPTVTVKPLTGQIDDLIEECRKRAEKHERVLVTTLTKRTSEDLADYFREVGIRVKYLHSEIDAIERVEILRGLRSADFDVLVGINLLREGLDLPEVSLVAILDADKEGFLRSATSLIQTAGRAARHINAEVILYADVMTDSINKFLETTDYRRAKQLAYNKEHNITPKTVKRELQLSLAELTQAREVEASVVRETRGGYRTAELLRELEAEMIEAAENLQFEKAAILRDQIAELKTEGTRSVASTPKREVKYDRKLRVNVVKKTRTAKTR